MSSLPAIPWKRQGTVPLDQAYSSRNLVQNVDNDINVYAQLSGRQSFASALHASFSASTRSITFPLTTLTNRIEHIYISIHTNKTRHVVSNLPLHTGGRHSDAQTLSRSTGRQILRQHRLAPRSTFRPFAQAVELSSAHHRSHQSSCR